MLLKRHKAEVLCNGEKQLDEFKYGTTNDWIEIDPGVARITISRDRAGITYFVCDAIAPVVANEDHNLILSDPLVIPAPVDRPPAGNYDLEVRLHGAGEAAFGPER